jgi:calreticulin
MMRTVATLALLTVASAEVFMNEQFDDDWKARWVTSEWKDAKEIGEWKHTAGKVAADAADKGIQTGEDARFYGLSAKMASPVSQTEGKPLVVQFSAKHEQNIDCGGGYIKLMPSTDQKKFGGDSPYGIMFGPDICGTSTRKTHVIFGHDATHAAGERTNLLTKKDIKCESDTLTHLYTLVVNSDNTYEVQIDQKKVEGGKLAEDFDFLLPEKIKDPAESKPATWVDEAKIPDPEDKKPDGHDDIPKKIPEVGAEKPDDWDDEDDGEWEPPMVDNPEFKGEWKAKMIENPDYKGEWVHPEIANPDFKDDKEMYKVCDPCDTVGFELWQVKAGTIFDDIIVADSVEEAKDAGDKVMTKIAAEKKAHEEAEAEQKKKDEAARAAADAEKKAADAKKAEEDDAADDADDEDEDEDDEAEEAPKKDEL